MPVCNHILRATTTGYSNRITLSKALVKCAIAQKSVLRQYQRISNQAGPAFIHNLRLHLWHEVQHLQAHDFENIALPGLQMWRMADQEEQDVFLGLLREFGRFDVEAITFLFGLACFFLQTPQVIVLGETLFRLILFVLVRLVVAQKKIVIDMLLDGEGCIQEMLNFIFAVIKLVLSDTLGMDTGLVDHAARGMLEVRVVLEEVSMT